MHKLLFLLFFSGVLIGNIQAQDLAKIRKEKAKQAIKALYNDGAVIVRLVSKAKNIEVLQRSLRSSQLNKTQRKRYQKTLNIMIEERDKNNKTIIQSFKDSFNFCPVYFIYDTSSRSLQKKEHGDIFLDLVDDKIVKTTDITFKENKENTFLVYYKKSGEDYPFDVFEIKALKGVVEEPFPRYVSVRSSFLTESKRTVIKSAIDRLDNKFKKFYLKNK
ncbi:MAG: hypothetical protein MK212_12740 [Saprospiraceae bacterium]|nr:hypothetical protein [Saprospiraceae bacterium]